ncbi:MAG: multicopper oxidase domain-containing protein [Proteobacteria bacterium]|nr:multicopper oxidase domain-containing protein [Pseudomonadota bacterium]
MMKSARRAGVPGRIATILFVVCAALAPLSGAYAQSSDPADAVCPRSAPGAALPAPADLYPSNHALELTLTLKTVTDAAGLVRYCYLSDAGYESPNLHVSPGDQLTIHLVNALPATGGTGASSDCSNDPMGPSTTNLHFHGLNLPPTCHQDDVLNVLVQPQTTFNYSVQIPADEPPGMYWYHPHPHGFSEAQVLGGAAGALIVDGIDTAVPATAGLTQRVFVLRDQRHPGTPAPGQPRLDLSVNFVPVPSPSYVAPVLATPAGAQELWRVLNASADEILDLQYQVNGTAQPVQIVSVDGIPVGQGTTGTLQPVTDTHVMLPAGARAEIIVTTPAAGASGQLVTLAVNSGGGFLYPARPLVNLTPAAGGSSSSATGVRRRVRTLPRMRFAGLSAASPDAQRLLYFSEGPEANGHFGYYITLDGQTPKSFAMSDPPALVLRQGTVEDWTIENRSNEDHVFHIHQLHFQVLAANGTAVTDNALRDTVNVPHWSGTGAYPSVTLRMDFRDPGIVGTFVYHCHLLAHEDNGMMAALQLLPAGITTQTVLASSAASVLAQAPLTLTATVNASGATAAGGTVQFSLDGAPLGAAVTVVNGQAVLKTQVAAGGAHTLTAAYSGDATHNESLSAGLALAVQDFTVNVAAISIPSAGQNGTAPVTIGALGGFTGNVALACTLPGELTAAHCSISPGSIAGSGQATLTIQTSAGYTAALGRLAPPGLALLALLTVRVRRRRLLRLAWLTVPLFLLGCGGGDSSPPTPSGDYTVTVTAQTTVGGVQLTHQVQTPCTVH